MVQTHGSVQLSLGAANISGVIDANSKLLLRLMPDSDGTPREPTQTSLKEVLSMMEVNGRKVWICLARGTSRKYTGYFSSIMELINIHVMNFVACLGAQAYWWLQQRGCLAEDVNRMVHHCFTLNHQQKITKSKYVSAKGYAIQDKVNSDDIINAVAGEGIYDTMLGLSDKERQMAIANKAYDTSAIMFGEAKEGAIEAHNFSSSASITTIHSKNVGDSRSVATEKMLAKLVFSMATSKVTSDGSEEEMDEEDDSDNSDAVSAMKPGVAIEEMQMLTRHHRNLSRDYMQEDNVSRVEEKDVRDIENKRSSSTHEEHQCRHGKAKPVVA
jgi:hypothetical protein